MKLEFPWPLLSLGDGEIDDLSDGGLVSETPLHRLGYRVGRTSQLTPTGRRNVLKLCFQAKKLEFSSDSSQSYKQAWGTANSAQRLRRIALHIKFMIDGPVGKDPRKYAKPDWTADLNWLKATYYPQFARRFTWPEISVR